jgi:hypothetical protein
VEFLMSKRIPTFEAFWPFYLSQHSVPLCRHLHFVGTGLALVTLVGSVVSGQWLGLLGVPVVGYGFAWVGHFVVEKNRPATFTYPLWSLMGDFKMLGLMLTGKLWTGVPVPPMTEAEAAG